MVTIRNFLSLFIATNYVLQTGCNAFLTNLRAPLTTPSHLCSTVKTDEVDVVVIGSGFGGLSAAALASKYGEKTVCVEAHDTPGGVAHSFSRFSKASKEVPFRFDSGPSLISGVSSQSTNPLRQVLDAVGTSDEIEWFNYDGWIVHDYADGKNFKLTTGDSGAFEKAIEEKAGREARLEFERFRDEMLADGGLTEVSGYIPPLALRGDAFVLRSLLNYLINFLLIGTKGLLLTGPFTVTMDKYNLKNPFLLKWFDYLAFALSGLDAAHTQAAPVSYTMGDLHRPGKVLDYPKGGMDSLIDALTKGLTNHGGELRLNSRVEKLLLEEKDGEAHCTGVVLSNGDIIKAKNGVVCNAPLWNMARMLEDSKQSQSSSPESPIDSAVAKVREQANDMEMTGSFMHLHIGIPKDGLPDDMEMHHSMLNFDLDVTAEQNLVIISIPTVADPSLAPEGYHIVHAYTAASENFDDWEGFLENSKDSGKVGTSPNSSAASQYNRNEDYEKFKNEKAEALWKAIECVIPDVRERAKAEGAISIVGSPLTHRRYV
jgi:phytoene dehydrogenase-like protein